MTKHTQIPQKTWLCVFETDGPRRSPEKPRVLVARKVIRPGPELDKFINTSKKLRKSRAKSVLYELMPDVHELGGRDNPFIMPIDQAKFKKAEESLCQRLKAEGYTVGDDQTVWRLYAIETKSPTKPRKPYRGHLYVGQTSIAVEDRIEQHRLGPAYPWKGKPKHSLDCHKNFLGPRFDLIPDQFKQPYFTREAALLAEADLRLYFEGLGYKVKGGKERYEQRKGLA